MIRDWLLGGLAGLLRPTQPAPAQPAPSAPTQYRIRSRDDFDALSAGDKSAFLRDTFSPKPPPPGVLPKGVSFDRLPGLAADDASMMQAMAGFLDGGLFSSGLAWPGYPYLAELTQVAEFRLISETIAEEMTRKWIVFESSSSTKQKDERIAELTKLCKEKYQLQDMFRRGEELDGEFGLGFLYPDLRNGNAPAWESADELNSPLVLDKRTIKKNSLAGFVPVEPIWTYPAMYNADNPLRDDFYRPRAWYVMGRTVHRDRMLKFLGREMPDILKPAYSFGGMSLTQMTKVAVDYALQTQGDVGRLINNFSTMVLYTDMSAALSGGGMDFLVKRAQLYNNLRNNQSLMLAQKPSGADQGEKLENVSVPLTALPELQQQGWEHIAFSAQIPLVKLLGITPSGLNVSSDDEIRTFYDRMAAFQEKRFGSNLQTVIHLIMLSEWGEIDEDITWRFKPLWQLDEAGLAAVQKTKSDIRLQDIESGQVSPEEARRSTAADPDSIYQGLNLDEGEAPGTQDVDGEGNLIPDRESQGIDRSSENAGGGGAGGAASGV